MKEAKLKVEGARAAGGARYAWGLFFLAPLVGEFLLGNLSITWLWTLMVLAPLYGGGAILIRETARRFGLGWPGIFLLGLAYALVEEAFVTQSLFNPNYVGLRLLDFGYIPWLGMSAWWTVFVLGIHVVWSTATPIALMEAVSQERRCQPWLGKLGLSVVVVVFILGCVASAAASAEGEAFMASTAQFAGSGVAVAVVVAMAFLVGRRGAGETSGRGLIAPSPLVAGMAGLVLGSAFMAWPLIHNAVPAGVNVAGMLVVATVGFALLAFWGRAGEWSPRHELAFAAGVTLTYVWYGFVQLPSVGDVSPEIDVIGNAVFALGATGLIWFAWKRVAASRVG